MLNIGYSKENLKIHMGVPSPPCLPYHTFHSLYLPFPLPLPSYIPLSLDVGPLESS